MAHTAATLAQHHVRVLSVRFFHLLRESGEEIGGQPRDWKRTRPSSEFSGRHVGTYTISTPLATEGRPAPTIGRDGPILIPSHPALTPAPHRVLRASRENVRSCRACTRIASALLCQNIHGHLLRTGARARVTCRMAAAVRRRTVESRTTVLLCSRRDDRIVWKRIPHAAHATPHGLQGRPKAHG
jgi:hypothetical protein